MALKRMSDRERFALGIVKATGRRRCVACAKANQLAYIKRREVCHRMG